MKPDIALTIAGSDSGGGAGVQADLKTFAALEVHGLSAITSVTAQNTQKVRGISDLPDKFVGEQIDAIAEDFEVKWAKTGMLSSAGIINVVRDKIKEHEIKLVVDPVMIAASGSPLLEEDAFEDLKAFLGDAVLVTPNVEEAKRLAETKINSVEEMKVAAEKISALGPENVLIKGGHLETADVHNILLQGKEFTELKAERVPVSDVHGSGCTFSAAITAELAKGSDVEFAARKAGAFMIDAIKGRLNIGEGIETVNPMAKAWKVTGDGEEIEDVQKAAKSLADSTKFSQLIPEVGVNIVMAPKNASKRAEVIGLTGRIVKVEDRPHLSGVPFPGGSEHVANFVLTAMEHDPQIRAGMNVKFSEEILEKFQNLDLKIASFDRNEEPQGAKTMKWGTKKAIERIGEVPDVIYDRGAVGKEPMIRLLGRRATEVSELALKVARMLK